MIDIFLLVIVVAFVLAFMDNTMGMGYGTLLTATLISLGFEPLQAVPAILLSGTINGLFISFAHHLTGNIDFDWRNTPNLKIALFLAGLSIIGVVLSIFLALSLPQRTVKVYIGVVVISMGLLTVFRHKIHTKFSWKKLSLVGLLAAFNKTMTGGGYGPLATAGQIVSGINSKESVAITALSESITSVLAVIAYILTGVAFNRRLLVLLTTGALLSVPLSAYFVKNIGIRNHSRAIGIIAILLGSYTAFHLVFL
ncbi:MAG: sulfite exporter TauE/SafE family protein [Theionarchaea archaeon]|nr:MAG: hypothetical protein AYK18_16135 [Theionarchaea archaeon DG-70]MBU7010466.1 sulfite exporter TauE/SafE family protein [Theionarchaea archaeon]